jgi:hypothetical protein
MNGGDSSRDMDNLGTKASGGCYYYHHHDNNYKSNRIFGHFDQKYYDQIITKLHLQVSEE